MKKVSIEMFPAKVGDSFLISIFEDNNKVNILIDGGFIETYTDFIKPRLEKMNKIGEKIDLLVVTHIDKDHIEGIIELFKDNSDNEISNIIKINEVWHNSYRHLSIQDNGNELEESNKKILEDIISKYSSKTRTNKNELKDISAKQGTTLGSYLIRGQYDWNKKFNNEAIFYRDDSKILLSDNIHIKILGPDLEDLDKLKNIWYKYVKTFSRKIKLNKNEFFDDAYEYYLKNVDEIEKNYTLKNISSSNIEEPLDIASYTDSKVKSDNSGVNKSSIAFILEIFELKFLFLGDAPDGKIVDKLKLYYKEDEFPIKFNGIKVAHHGSKYNNLSGLFDLIFSDTYIISTDGTKNNHPHTETIAKIVTEQTGSNKNLIFNYNLSDKIWNLEVNSKKYKYKNYYPLSEKSITNIVYSNNEVEVKYID